jgi:hypothetical protein
MTFNLTVVAPLTVNCAPASGPADVGAAYSATCTASGGTAPYGWSVGSGALPAGVTLSAAAGASINVSGAPTTAGAYTYSIKVTDSTTPTAQTAGQSYSGTISTAVTVSTASLPNGAVGVAYGQTLTASGGAPPYSSWTVVSGTLPSGLALTAGSGAIGGTPTASGAFPFSVTVKDSAGNTSPAQSLSIMIGAGVTVTTASLPNGTVGVAYGQTLTASGGAPPYSSWTVSAGSLPNGLSLTAGSGAISGTPTASGAFPFSVTVKDSAGNTSPAQSLSITIGAGVTVTTTSLPNGTVGVAYGQTLAASGGAPPYSNWTVVSGALPGGLTLTAGSGPIGGTPTAAGTFPFSVTVKDSAGNTSPAQSLSITTGAGVTVATTSLPNGTLGVAYGQTLAASGGVPPYSNWTVASGALPSGLTLTAGSGVIGGTPTASGAFSFSVTVKDSAGNTSPAQSLSITIGAGVTITTTSLPNGTVGVAYGQTLAASGGVPPYSNWTVVSGALPGGLTLTAGSGAIGGTPTASGAFPFSVTVKDSAGNTSPAQSLTIAITVQPVQGLTITQSGGASAPNQTNLLVSFGQAAQSTYTGTLSASFQPDPSVTNVPVNYIDPAGGFPVSAQSTALTQNFTMSLGATQSSIQFGLGTVAGTWTVILTSLSTGGESALPTSPPRCTVPVAAAAPSITAGSVQIVNLTSSGFSVQLTGFATTRDVSSAAFVFTAAAGAQLQGTTVTVPFDGQDQSQWFDTTASLSSGGTFSLLLPFGYSGDPNALGSVAATLTNSRGQTSASVTGAP